ncbi:unnamed protein product, partial [Nesidiocoris tenuis]
MCHLDSKLDIYPLGMLVLVRRPTRTPSSTGNIESRTGRLQSTSRHNWIQIMQKIAFSTREVCCSVRCHGHSKAINGRQGNPRPRGLRPV